MLDLSTLARPFWLMEPGALQAAFRRLDGLKMPSPRMLEKNRKVATERLRKVSGKVAVVPVCGMIEHRYSAWSYFFGGASTEALGMVLDSLAANKECAAIILDIDSPGGDADGVEELADKIFSLRAAKPIYGVCNALCASAAYWIGSQCSNLYCTPSGRMGSVGAYQVHVDYSKMMEEGGVRVTFVSSSPKKVAGNPYAPLDPETQEDLQEDIDTLASKFIKAVARGRATSTEDVRKNFGQGGLLDADEAVAAKMCDGPTMSLDTLLGKLGGQNPKSDRVRGPSMAVLNARFEAAKAGVA